MATKRVNGPIGTIDQGSAISIGFNQYAGAHKQLPTGAMLNIMGTLAADIDVGYGESVWVYNNSGTVAYISFYSPTNPKVAPTDLANGIPVPPNSYLVVGSGTNNIITGSAASLGVYVAQDDSVLNPNNAG